MKKILLGDELLIIFALIGEETFALEIKHVLSIMEAREMRKVPLAPPYLDSIINYHGQIGTVFDMKMFFDGERSKGEEKKVIYLKHDELHVGLIVDKILGIDYVSPTTLEAFTEEEGESPQAKFSSGFFVLEEDAPGIYWLDIKKVESFVLELDVAGAKEL